MARKRNDDPFGALPCLSLVDGSGRVVPVTLDGRTCEAMTLEGPVDRGVPLFVEMHLVRVGLPSVVSEIMAALAWGYMVRALPRRGGPCDGEVRGA